MSSKHCSLHPLLRWYQKKARDLPWRHTSAAYPIWISEIMLQQTQVSTVVPRYHQWLSQFSDIQTLSDADEDTVLKVWEGLGYYRRARYIHRAAQQIMQHHHGQFPHSFEDILALPGIGRSTAGAISSFCFSGMHAVLDANVKRVITRYRGELKAAEQWQLAEALLRDSAHPAQWNQAMMELGATVCRIRSPLCEQCPLTDCRSRGNVPMPEKRPKKRVQNLYWQVAIHTRNQQSEIWLQRRPNSGIWGGLWTPPIEAFTEAPVEEPSVIHLLTHRRLHLYGHHTHEPPPDSGRWFKQGEYPALPVGIQRLFHTCFPLNNLENIL